MKRRFLLPWTPILASSVVERFQTAGIEPVGAGPDAYRREIERENQAMAKAGKAADLKAE